MASFPCVDQKYHWNPDHTLTGNCTSSPVLSLPILQHLAHHLTLEVIVEKMAGVISVKLTSSAAKEKGRRPVKPNRKKAGSLRAIKRIRGFNPSAKESFWWVHHHVMNSEG